METTWSDFDAANHQKIPFSFEKELLNPLFSLWKKQKQKQQKLEDIFCFYFILLFSRVYFFSKGLFIFYY